MQLSLFCEALLICSELVAVKLSHHTTSMFLVAYPLVDQSDIRGIISSPT